MQTITITGNIGKDAELRTTQGGDDVLSFNVGSQQGYGDRASTNWFRCSLWGKRAKSLKDHLLKGTKVAVAGDLEIGEYEGKTQLNIRVNQVEFMSRAKADGQQRDSGESRGGGGGSAFDADLDDDCPF